MNPEQKVMFEPKFEKEMLQKRAGELQERLTSMHAWARNEERDGIVTEISKVLPGLEKINGHFRKEEDVEGVPETFADENIKKAIDEAKALVDRYASLEKS